MNEEPTFQREEEDLAWSWDRHPDDFLDDYLVSGVEDPRVNLTSVLVRGMIADRLFPGKFDDLIEEEARFSCFFTWYLKEVEGGRSVSELAEALMDEKGLPPEILDLVRHARSVDGVPDYTVFERDSVVGSDALVPESILNTFMNLWRMALESEEASDTLRVLEAACGSANDYRFLDRCGLARFLDYTGFDISARNIENARRRFPNVAFHVGSVMDIPLENRAVDITLCFDLWEHLSLAAMERGMSEMMRVSAEEFWTGYFALYEQADHEEKPVDRYHCNALSASKLTGWFADRGWESDVIWLREWQQGKFGIPAYYNAEAAIGIAARAG